MNYLQELLESYSRLKQRKLKLLEQTGKEIQGSTPQQRIQFIISQLPHSKEQPAIYTKKNPLILTLGGKQFKCYVSSSQKQVTVDYGGGTYNIEKSPEKLYPHLEIGEPEQPAPKKGKAEQPMPSEGGAGQPGAMPGEKPPPLAIDIVEGDLLDPMTLQDSISHLPKQEQLAILAQAGKLTNTFYTTIDGQKRATLLGAIKRTRHIIDCPDPNSQECIPKTIDDPIALSTAQEIGALNLQTALQLLTKGKNLTLDEVEYLKSIIVISQKNQVIIKDPVSNKGIMIYEGNEFLVPLLTALASKHEIDTDKGKVKLSLTDDKQDFLSRRGAVLGLDNASTVRGGVFERLRMGVIEMQRCLQTQQDKTKCLQTASEHFRSWSDTSKIDNAFIHLQKQYEEDGTISIDLDNADDMFYVEAIVNGFGKGSFENATKAFQKFSLIMTQLAIAGVRERRPIAVEKVGQITGIGRKADTREYYATREDAERALRSVNLHNANSVEIIETPRGFALNDSLKFTTLAKEVCLGQASTSKMLPTLNCALGIDTSKCDEDVQNQIRMLERSGLTKKDFEYIRGELIGIQKKVEKFMKESVTKVTRLSNGELLTRRSKDKLIENVLAYLDSNDTFGGPTQELRSKLRVMVNQAKTTGLRNDKVWEELCLEIADALQKNKLEKMISGTDKKQKRKAIGFMVGVGMFSGGAGDHSMLSVADARNLEIHTTDQTETLRALMDALKPGSNAKVEVKNNKFLVNDIPIHWDGNTGTVHISLQTVIDTIKRGYGVSKKVKKLDQGMEQPAMQTNSVEYSGETLNEQVINYLVNQQKLLNKLLKSITKGALH